MRKQVLDRLKYVRTCALARELCLIIRMHRGVLNPEDVHKYCLFISKLCKEAGCDEPSELCAKAAEAVLNDEEKYLRLCAESCRKCGESRRPKEEREVSRYVA